MKEFRAAQLSISYLPRFPADMASPKRKRYLYVLLFSLSNRMRSSFVFCAPANTTRVGKQRPAKAINTSIYTRTQSSFTFFLFLFCFFLFRNEKRWHKIYCLPLFPPPASIRRSFQNFFWQIEKKFDGWTAKEGGNKSFFTKKKKTKKISTLSLSLLLPKINWELVLTCGNVVEQGPRSLRDAQHANRKRLCNWCMAPYSQTTAALVFKSTAAAAVFSFFFEIAKAPWKFIDRPGETKQKWPAAVRRVLFTQKKEGHSLEFRR